jgi:hypothetical protein
VTPPPVAGTLERMRGRLPPDHRSDAERARHVLLPVLGALLVIGLLAALVGDCSQSGSGVEGVLLRAAGQTGT